MVDKTPASSIESQTATTDQQVIGREVQTVTNVISQEARNGSGDVIATETQTSSRKELTTSGAVVELLKANTTLAAWLIFLAIGGGLLALYYARIGYLPDIEWGSSLIYLAAASIIGGGFAMLFALSLFVPGFIWQEFLVFDTRMSKILRYDKGREPCIKAILTNIGVAFGFALFASHVSLLFLPKVALFGPKTTSGYLSIIALLLLAASSTYIWIRFNSLLKTLPHKDSDSQEPLEDAELRKRRLFKYAFWFTLSVFLSQISMLLVYLMSGRPEGSNFWILTFTCTAGVLISNHVVAIHYRNNRRQAVAASLVIASLLLFTADRFSPLSLRVMAYFGLGGDRKVNLVVNDEGTEIIRKLALPNKCITVSPDRLCGLEILSKLGNEYYLSLEGRTFTLPKKDVLSTDSTDRRRK
jgi:hypothetical protein